MRGSKRVRKEAAGRSERILPSRKYEQASKQPHTHTHRGAVTAHRRPNVEFESFDGSVSHYKIR